MRSRLDSAATPRADVALVPSASHVGASDADERVSVVALAANPLATRAVAESTTSVIERPARVDADVTAARARARAARRIARVADGARASVRWRTETTREVDEWKHNYTGAHHARLLRLEPFSSSRSSPRSSSSSSSSS
jgi:hypothetical protein